VLDKAGVRLVAVGMEETLGDFVEGHFFAGDLFVDEGHHCYTDLKLKKLGMMSAFGLLDPRVRTAFKLAGQIPSNYSYSLSHGNQLGGTFVLDAGGKVLLEHRQDHHGDHVDNSRILEILNLQADDTGVVTTDP